jgi:hypothetical protein
MKASNVDGTGVLRRASLGGLGIANAELPTLGYTDVLEETGWRRPKDYDSRAFEEYFECLGIGSSPAFHLVLWPIGWDDEAGVWRRDGSNGLIGTESRRRQRSTR